MADADTFWRLSPFWGPKCLTFAILRVKGTNKTQFFSYFREVVFLKNQYSAFLGRSAHEFIDFNGKT